MDDESAGPERPSAPLPSSRRSVLRRALLAAIALLYAISIPWYRESAELPRVWWGLPDWVAVAVASYAAVAVLNALAWLLTDVPDAEPSDEGSA